MGALFSDPSLPLFSGKAPARARQREKVHGPMGPWVFPSATHNPPVRYCEWAYQRHTKAASVGLITYAFWLSDSDSQDA